jgi:hypothetical protein
MKFRRDNFEISLMCSFFQSKTQFVLSMISTLKNIIFSHYGRGVCVSLSRVYLRNHSFNEPCNLFSYFQLFQGGGLSTIKFTWFLVFKGEGRGSTLKMCCLYPFLSKFSDERGFSNSWNYPSGSANVIYTLS